MLAVPELVLGSRRIWYRQGTDHLDPEQPTVVFLHGAGASSLSWIYQLRALRRALNCVALDLPGHGKSDDDPALDTVERLAEATLDTLQALVPGPLALVGHAMGGAIALECAVRSPERVAALALIATGAVMPVSPLIFEALRGSGEVYLRFLEDLAFSPTTPKRFVEKSSASGLPAPREVVARDFRAAAAWQRHGRLADLGLPPTLLVVGRDDAMTPVPLVEALAAELTPPPRLEIVEDAGHMVMIEQHKHLNELLVGFLDARLPSTTPTAPASERSD